MNTKESTHLQDLARARRILYPDTHDQIPGEGPITPKDLADLGKKLSKADEFGYARMIYLVASKHPDLPIDEELKLKVIQQHALCTSKDVNLPQDVRLACALSIINKAESLSKTIPQKQETLGITGGIYKRKWEVDNQSQHLEAALNCYESGYNLGSMSDMTGYTGINAAFVYDILAWQDEESSRASGQKSVTAERLRKEATDIRTKIANELSALATSDEKVGKDKWVQATLAEAYFGLKNYAQAKVWLDKYSESAPDEWERETTARQFAALARYQDSKISSWNEVKSSKAWEVLNEFLHNKNGLLAGFVGKLGLDWM